MIDANKYILIYKISFLGTKGIKSNSTTITVQS